MQIIMTVGKTELVRPSLQVRAVETDIVEKHVVGNVSLQSQLVQTGSIH